MPSTQSKKRYSVLGVCYSYANLRKYILWALKLMEDMPQIFDRIEFSTTIKPGFDVYLVDDIHESKPLGLVVHFKSNIICLS